MTNRSGKNVPLLFLPFLAALFCACDRKIPAAPSENPGAMIDASPSPMVPEPQGGDGTASPQGNANKETDQRNIDKTREGKVAAPKTH